MPELPEAENICRALARNLCGRVITGVEIFAPAMRTPLAPLLSAGLTGRRITRVHRRGRYVIMCLDDRRGIVLHFGMSGVVRVEDSKVPRRKHEHIFLHLDDRRIFRFECTRRFSLCEVHPLDAGDLPPVLGKLGVEPLSDHFTAGVFLSACRRRNVPVKNLLMDNAVVVGIGNIYAAESLFAAGIDPRRSCRSLNAEEAERLTAAVKTILQEAIKAGGTTVSDFLNVDGSEGKFVQQLRVYGKRGEQCCRCRSGIIDTCRQGGRTTFFCPVCQQ